MRKRIFAVLMVMSLLIIGGLIYTQGIFAADNSNVGVRVFRVADITTPGGATAGNVGELIQGATSKLMRTPDGISMVLNTKKLPAGAYSIWWLIDNDNDDTTGLSPGLPLVFGIEIARRGTGGIVGADGVGNFKATLAAAMVPPVNGATVLINASNSTVLDPDIARVALVIRYHGPVIPGAVNEQINLFAGGCANPPTLGMPGAFVGGNVCFDPQATEFHVP